MSEKKQKKPKKEKTVYIDDGRTIADMSPVVEARKRGSMGERDRAPKREAPRRPRATFREQLDTFFAAQRMMFGPMLVAIVIISLAFLILWLLAR